jgi:hypothetical protein
MRTPHTSPIGPPQPPRRTRHARCRHKPAPSNRHSCVGFDHYRGVRRGFLPRGLCDTCPQARAARRMSSRDGQVSHNPKRQFQFAAFECRRWRSTLRADRCHLLGHWRASSFRVDRPDVPETLTGRFRQPPSFGRSNSDVAASQSSAAVELATVNDSARPRTALSVDLRSITRPHNYVYQRRMPGPSIQLVRRTRGTSRLPIGPATLLVPVDVSAERTLVVSGRRSRCPGSKPVRAIRRSRMRSLRGACGL